MDPQLINTFKTIVSSATPLVIAALGETIIERAGVINLSLDGSIMLSAMAGFVAVIVTQSLVIGVLVAMLVGALMALIIAWGNISLKQDQVAIGFVLTLLGGDLAQFLGQNYTSANAPISPDMKIPLLSEIPVVGQIFFTHDLFVYISYALIFGCWWWLFRTRRGLAHRAVGERPAAAFARGVDVNRLRYLYTIAGGALVGLAGAAYSLNVKAGWDNPPSMRGDGWIALAIVIFAGWHPFRVVLGAYLFAGLRALTSALQKSDIEIPLIVLNAIPWVMMVLTLVLVSSGTIDRLLLLLPESLQKRARTLLRSDPPKALGTRWE